MYHFALWIANLSPLKHSAASFSYYGSIKNIHLYLNFVFFGFKIVVFFRFNL